MNLLRNKQGGSEVGVAVQVTGLVTEDGKPTVSVLIPAHNERDNLGDLIHEIEASLDSASLQIVVVDDGSTDGTLTMLDELRGQVPTLLLIGLETRGGKTRAIQEGFARCKGDVVVLMDADQQYSPEDIPRLLQQLKSADVVNGARVDRQDPEDRLLASAFYNSLVNALFNLRFVDSNSGLKVFRRQVLERIIPGLRPGWHRYLLPLADAAGARIVEMPVNHFERTVGSSKFSSPLRLVKGMFDLLAVLSYANPHASRRRFRGAEMTSTKEET